MAKAPAALLPHNLTAKDATVQICALINSRPVSPWPHEIEAIVARVAGAPQQEGTSLLAVKLRNLMPPLRRSLMDECEAPMRSPALRAAENCTQDLNDKFYPLVREMYATPPASLEDLVIRAEVAQFQARDWPPPYEHLPMLSDASLGSDEVASIELRQLVIGVLQMGGRRYAV